jgi:hypothetical protein
LKLSVSAGHAAQLERQSPTRTTAIGAEAMRAWSVFLFLAAAGCLTSSPGTAQPIQLDPNETVLVSYERVYFFLTARDGETRKQSADSTVVFFKARNGYSVDFNNCQFRLRPFKERTFPFQEKSYAGMEFKLADPIIKSNANSEFCKKMSLGSIFLGLNEWSIFFVYNNLLNYPQGYVQEELIQLYDILWPMRASEAYSPAGRAKWRSQESVVSLPDWLKPAIVIGLAALMLKLMCGDRDLKTCTEPLR